MHHIAAESLTAQAGLPYRNSGSILASPRRLKLTLAVGMSIVAMSAAANGDPASDAPKPRAPGDPVPLVQWLVPALAPTKPQTETLAKAAIQNGRIMVEPEILQPRLDQALPSYQPRKDIKIAGTFIGGASDVLPPLVQRWFAGFKKYYPDVNISIAPPYAGSLGAIELVKEKLDFVFVSRELKPDDIKDFSAKFGYAPLSVPISGGSYRHFGFLDTVAFFVNKDNPLEQLNYAQIDALFSTTNHHGSAPVKTWGDLGLTGEWADKPIHLYGIKPWNGFEEFVRQKILSTPGKRGEWREDIRFDKQVFPVAARVAADKYGIAYSGVAYIDSGVKMIPLGVTPQGPYISPTYENVALATYPLSRLVYFNTNKKPGKTLDPALDEFLKYILSKEGQQVVLDHALYVPLRAGQVKDARQLLEK